MCANTQESRQNFNLFSVAKNYDEYKQNVFIIINYTWVNFDAENTYKIFVSITQGKQLNYFDKPQTI